MLALQADTQLTGARQAELLHAMRPVCLGTVFQLVAAALRSDGAEHLKLGYWPRLAPKALTRATYVHKGLITTLRQLFRAVAPGLEVTAILLSHGPGTQHRDPAWTYPTAELFCDGAAAWAYTRAARVAADPVMTPLYQQVVQQGGRLLRMTVGRVPGALSQRTRIQLKTAGFGISPAV